LQGLARRAEYLWQLVVRRLEISERDISRKIDVWGADPEWLHQPIEAVQREDVLADLEAVDTPYWRLKTLMDAWCALWFWPVQEASLLDGTNPRYRHAAELAEQSAAYDVVVADPQDEDTSVLQSWEEDALPGFDVEAKQLSLTQEAVDKRRMGRRKEAITEQRRAVIPLANLDDWLDFAESLLGTQDVPSESLVAAFESLTELTPYEDALPDLMGMDRSYWLESRFPWAAHSKDIATQQGFFHWELEYAQVFEQGGYDLQVGNPPWVRPRWQEDLVLAELDPWFALTEKSGATEWRLRKTELLGSRQLDYCLEELATNVGIVTTLGSTATYPILTGTQPDLYRAFMCRTWQHINGSGTIGLVHPDTHFSGVKEGTLRSSAYSHLRVHAGFINEANWAFPHPVGHTTAFGVHVYGPRKTIGFTHLSNLYGATVATQSLTHDGHGELPGVKRDGAWDLRPHRERAVFVDSDLLNAWQKLGGDTSIASDQAPLLYPVTTAESGAIRALSSTTMRLGDLTHWITSGHHEKSAKDKGQIHWHTGVPASHDDAVMQGPHIGISNPFSKQPNIPCRTHLDWASIDATTLAEDASLRTNYERSSSREDFNSSLDSWNDAPYTRRYRSTWRRRIDPKSTERSLFVALIPPGPSHVNAP
ncbi:class I SAM-dependent DNA methyltransferase, partial [Streptomyces sp. NPDC059956]